MKKKVAFIISRILGPVPLLIILWLTTALKSGVEFGRAIWIYPLILFITLIIPVCLTTYLISVKRVSDIEWKDIKSRRKFLIPIGIYSLTTLIILTYFLVPGTVFHLVLLFGIIMLSAIAIYTFTNFKISGHIIVATATVANINLWYHQKYLWLFIVLIPIIWARYVLKIHTIAEMLAGLILTSAILILGLLFFGWPSIP